MLRSARILALGLFVPMLAALANLAPAAADGPPSTVIISDTSGSMEGFLGTERKRLKYEIVRDAMRASLVKTSPKNRIGLVAFGHRQRGCSDAELILPPDAGPADRVLGALDRLKPVGGRGTTPLVMALREAHKSLIAGGPPPGPASIIVVYDGADRCGQDACQAAQEFVKLNIRIPIHVVALGVDKGEIPRMACVANITGGKIFEAIDIPTADAAIAQAVKLALLDHAAPEPEPQAEAAPAAPAPPAPTDLEGPPRVRLTASLGPNTAALGQPIMWRIFKDGAAEAPVLERSAAEVAEPLEAGKYQIEARYGLVLTRGTITVADKGLTAVRVPLNAGAIRVSAKAARTGTPLDGLVTVSRKEPKESGEIASSEPIWIGRGDAEIVVPAGTYSVKLEDDLVQSEQTVTLAPGGKAVSEFTPGLGYLSLSATMFEGGAPVSGASFLIAVDDPDSPLGRREIARSAHPEPSFTLPAGTYYVTARFGDAEVRQRVPVGPGDTVQRSLALGLARLEVSAALEAGAAPAGGPVQHRVVTLDAELREVARSMANPATFTLAAGRYRIETLLGNENVRTTTDVEIQAGKDGRLVQKLAAGSVTIRGIEGAGSQAAAGAWEVRDSRGLVVWRAGSAQPATALLAPGRYVARSDTATRTSETAFEIRAGEQRTVDLVTP